MWSLLWRAIAAVSALILVIGSAPLLAQTPAPVRTPALTQAEAGLESPDAARAIVADVLKQDDQLRGILNGIDPKEWYEKKGAPSTYVIQWQTEQSALRQLDLAARQFSQKVEDLTAALDLYFWMEAAETTARAVNEGAQRYADRTTADRLASILAHNFDARQRFRDYIRELAISVQQNFKIADEEAQRCRAAQSQEPPPCATTRKRG